jgi:hypothetical protein
MYELCVLCHAMQYDLCLLLQLCVLCHAMQYDLCLLLQLRLVKNNNKTM